jgi:hypothetical protein
MNGIATRTFSALGRFFDKRSTAWGVGVIMPLAMVLLDPIVFQARTMGFEQPLLGRYRTACYLGIAGAVAALVIVLTTGKAKAFLSGVMMAAATLSLLLGVVILPFSLFGILFLGVGLLGFSPFLAAALFARWGYRSLRASTLSRRHLSALAGAIAFCGILVGTQFTVSHVLQSSIDDILSGRLRKSRAATERLRRWRLFVDLDEFIPVWARQADPQAKQRLAEAYRAITGDALEDRAARVAD